MLFTTFRCFDGMLYTQENCKVTQVGTERDTFKFPYLGCVRWMDPLLFASVCRLLRACRLSHIFPGNTSDLQPNFPNVYSKRMPL